MMDGDVSSALCVWIHYITRICPLLQQVRVLFHELLATIIRSLDQMHRCLHLQAVHRLRIHSLLRASFSCISLVMDIFVGLYSLLHHFVNVVDVLCNILSNICVECKLILFELALLLIEQDPRLFQVLVKVEANLLLQAFLQQEDIILHQTELPCAHVKLVNKVISAREHLRIDDLV